MTARIADPLALLAGTTPGPWETSSNAEGQFDVCGPDAGDMIADLAECPENAGPNAHLMAAAPCMARDLAEARAERDTLREETAMQRERIDGLCAQVAELAGALGAIRARIAGVYDDPDLLAFGPLGIDTEADCAIIARDALAKAAS